MSHRCLPVHELLLTVIEHIQCATSCVTCTDYLQESKTDYLTTGFTSTISETQLVQVRTQFVFDALMLSICRTSVDEGARMSRVLSSVCSDSVELYPFVLWKVAILVQCSHSNVAV